MPDWLFSLFCVHLSLQEFGEGPKIPDQVSTSLDTGCRDHIPLFEVAFKLAVTSPDQEALNNSFWLI
jgi:hypothetical protein